MVNERNLASPKVTRSGRLQTRSAILIESDSRSYRDNRLRFRKTVPPHCLKFDSSAGVANLCTTGTEPRSHTIHCVNPPVFARRLPLPHQEAADPCVGVSVHGISRFRCAKQLYWRDTVFRVFRTNLSTQNFLELVRSPHRGEQRYQPRASIWFSSRRSS